jgi:hypothetical protein
MNVIAYVQIYSLNYMCQTFPTPSKLAIFITPENNLLKKNGTTTSSLVSQQRNIEILKTFIIPFEKIKNIFFHAKDKVLDTYIDNGTLIVVGDNNEISLRQPVEIDFDVPRVGLGIQATKKFLYENNIP